MSSTTAGEAPLTIDGAQPISDELVARINQMCDRAETLGPHGYLVLHAGGAPAKARTDGLTVGLVSRWERALRRLERSPVALVGIADGEVGGTALDAFLATDYRIATPAARLTVPIGPGATWPGMALYRLAHQGSHTAAVRRALLFGEPIGAPDALALHLLDAVTDDVAGALRAADRLSARVSGPELAIRRQLMIDAATVSFEEALGAHLAACDRMLRQAAA